jgi:squalene-hopene/tetraprenyl-beta-curcumene cyclase
LACSAIHNTIPQSNLRSQKTLQWLLTCQHRRKHPFTGAAPGGWGWTVLSGAVPDADDTAGALLALARLLQGSKPLDEVLDGIRWLLSLRNADGGIPTFCRGWGLLPFDQSSTDLTAHTIRAFRAWRKILELESKHVNLLREMSFAEGKMLDFLKKSQQKDGSWNPLWFGSQYQKDEMNPFYGTARVLLALSETSPDEEMTRNGLRFLIDSQNADGGWGSLSSQADLSSQSGGCAHGTSGIEETAVTVEALSMFAHQPEIVPAYHRGLNWLLNAVESGRWLEPSPIGLYFAKLWYYEELYPIIFTVSALNRFSPAS